MYDYRFDLNFDVLDKPMGVGLLNAMFRGTTIDEEEYLEFKLGVPLMLPNGKVVVSVENLIDVPREMIEVVYSRIRIDTILGGLPFMLSMRINDITPVSLAEELFKEYRIHLDTGHYELTEVTVPNAAVVYPGFRRYTLTILDTHLTLCGKVDIQIAPTAKIRNVNLAQTIGLMDHYIDYLKDSRLPVEILMPESKLRAETHALSSVTTSTTASMLEVAHVLRGLTGDDWVSVLDAKPFNLYGAELIYNDLYPVSARQPCANYGKLLELRLSEFCTNLKGVLSIPYRETPRKPKQWR